MSRYLTCHPVKPHVGGGRQPYLNDEDDDGKREDDESPEKSPCSEDALARCFSTTDSKSNTPRRNCPHTVVGDDSLAIPLAQHMSSLEVSMHNIFCLTSLNKR
jgi:hypothetical protein